MRTKQEVVKFFKEHPDKVKFKRGLWEDDFIENSYIIDKATNQIFMLSNKSCEKVGGGGYGQVKKSQYLDDPVALSMVTKVQKIIKDDKHDERLERMKNEAKINIDVGVAIADCVIRDEPNFSKLYQNMYNLGVSLYHLLTLRTQGCLRVKNP